MASSSSSIPQIKHDVFLSFRGEDTRYNFTSHLYSSFCEKQIQTFIDNQLPRGDEISPSLLNTIEASNISVVIFSERYASSGWCLDELVKIIECRNMHGQIVIPIFYCVDPSDVRNQSGVFGEFFSELKQRSQKRLDKLHSWRNALIEAANIAGFHYSVIRAEFESKFIKEITESILKRLEDKFESYDENHLIGVEPRIKEIESQLRIGSTGVYTIGIWGMGGIGKTTIARAIFEKRRSHFDSSCFIENVREGEDKNGLTHLRQQLFSTLFQNENVKIDDVNISFHHRRVQHKKVFIVFDDVTHLRQIEFFIGRPSRVGEGSRIIVTTRNKQVLKNCAVNEIYEMEQLLEMDALKLFSLRAFKQNRPDVGYEELSMEIIKYAQGIPLALKVLGCFLLEKENNVWRSAIEKLKRVPNKDIQQVLKISYDGLEDHEKNIFLDIACFFNWKEKDYITTFLDGCGFFAEIGISILVDKCLLVESYNKIIMHDLLKEMGREIVRQESTNDPGKRSRLWHYKDIYKVLTRNTRTEAIQGISFDMSKVEEIRLRRHIFTKMPNLRFLNFYGENKCKLSHSFDPAFSEVRYFRWDGYPMKSLPLHSRFNNLVSLELPELRARSIGELWNGIENLVMLKRIDLSNSKQLVKLPNLSKAPNLEKLILEGCSSLVEIDSSIQHLSKLVIMDLRDCESLRSLPPTICTESLETLVLSGCRSLKRFPEISSSRLVELRSLKYFYLSDCPKLERLPDELGHLEALEWLEIQRTSIREIPRSIKNLSNLLFLLLGDCKRLRYLPELPCSLFIVIANDCTSLEAISTSGSLEKGCSFFLTNCFKLNQTNVRKIVEYSLKARCKEWDQVGRHRGHKMIYPGNEIPEWFEFRSMGSFISFELPHGWFNNKYVGIAHCAVVAYEEEHYLTDHLFALSCETKVKTKDGQWHKISDTGGYGWRIKHSRANHVILGTQLLTGSFAEFHYSNEVLIQFHGHFGNKDCSGLVKKCGVHLLYSDFGKSMKDRSRSLSSTDEEEPHPKRLKN
ncbi:putative disease resistance protein (TIR-NBS-LRR class) [Melia azedarach]|uniref:Disease resistance protein (TIR-NBS-LRR class) n=1 Tax=Melia azedarach TaxID=155640 RepID=A0ACC1YJ71_MELAZ|nr:putative disease resistance protein (TIR-NBS-LRR class) [Melia azedarach]